MKAARIALVLSCVLLGAIGLFIKGRQHKVVVFNEWGQPVKNLSVRVLRDERIVPELRAGDYRRFAFRNTWPTDAALVLRMDGENGDQTVEHQCLYLGALPQLVVVRLRPEGIECKTVGPATLVP